MRGGAVVPMGAVMEPAVSEKAARAACPWWSPSGLVGSFLTKEGFKHMLWICPRDNHLSLVWVVFFFPHE